MIAAEYDLNIDRGSTFSQTFVLTDPSTEAAINLAGYTARSEVRRNYSASTSLIDFTIVIVSATGSITISATAAETTLESEPEAAGINPTPLRGVWDLDIIDGSGTVTKLMRGKAYMYPRVSE